MDGNLGVVAAKGLNVFMYPREGKALVQEAEISLCEAEFIRRRKSKYFCRSACCVKHGIISAKLTRNAIVDDDGDDVVFRSKC